MVEYLDGPIIKDTKNILHQIFVKKYCKQMQSSRNFCIDEKMATGRYSPGRIVSICNLIIIP
jgi:hypothetical protein